MKWYYWVIIAVIIFFIYASYNNKLRREKLMEKYKDAELVELLMGNKIWQGQTEEQLKDSLGNPVVIDQKVLKTKTKEIWKYNKTGNNRFALKITLENKEVIGWEKKS